MKPKRNPQYGNVGNACDRLKHGALVALLQALGRHYPEAPCNHLETHAFRLRAPLADPQWCWQGEPQAYADLEAPHVDRGRYLCSVGLVRALLPEARLFLAERHPPTRRRLRRELASSGARAEIRPRAAAWGQWKKGAVPGVWMVLVDPFRMRPKVWRWAGAAVARLVVPGAAGVTLAFDYRKDGAAPTWPEPWPGWQGPLARLEASPCHLAVYGCGEVRGWGAEVEQALDAIKRAAGVSRPGPRHGPGRAPHAG